MVIMLRQCCCGCSLKTGTIIIGVLNILSALMNLASAIGLAAKAGTASADNKNVLIGTGAVLAFFAVILLMFSIFLIRGALKNNPTPMLPWMVYSIFFLVANTVLYVIYAAEFFTANDNAGGAGYIIAAIIYVLIETYFLLVVYSLYRELKGTAPTSHA